MSATDLTFINGDGQQQVWQPRSPELTLGDDFYSPLPEDAEWFVQNPHRVFRIRLATPLDKLQAESSPKAYKNCGHYRAFQPVELCRGEPGPDCPYTIVQYRMDQIHRRVSYLSMWDFSDCSEDDLLRAIEKAEEPYRAFASAIGASWKPWPFPLR